MKPSEPRLPQGPSPLACPCSRTFLRVKKPVSWGVCDHLGQKPLLEQPLLTRLNGIPYFLRMMGEMRVILCRRKASQPWELPGKNPGVKKTGISLKTRVGAEPGQLFLGSSFLLSEHRAGCLQHQGYQPHGPSHTHELCW